jgi:hypothetical protein
VLRAGARVENPGLVTIPHPPPHPEAAHWVRIGQSVTAFEDVITVAGLSTGSIVLSFHVTGDRSAAASSGANFSIYSFDDETQFVRQLPEHTDDVYEGTFAFTAGRLHDDVALVAFARLGGPIGGTTALIEGLSFSDFATSAVFTRAQVLSPTGLDVTSDVTLRSNVFVFAADGTVSSVVPEPGTPALLGTGLLMLGGFAGRRKRTA